MLNYFVSYMRQDEYGGTTFGRCSIQRKDPIVCIEDIFGIEDFLNNGSVVFEHHILSWRRFEDA